MSKQEPEAVDVDSLLKGLRDQADQAKQLSDEIQREPIAPPVGDDLIDEVSRNLATIRRATSLPNKDAADFKARIKGLQRDL
jgi:hypothetical protein